MKKLIAALALGMLIGSATTALAAPDVVQATVAKFKFVVNGQEREVKTEQLVVMGTTYLPVREVANMLGHDVTYKADSQTIELNEVNGMRKSTQVEGVEELPQISQPEQLPEHDGWVGLTRLAPDYKLIKVQSDNLTDTYIFESLNTQLVIDRDSKSEKWETGSGTLESNLGPIRFKLDSFYGVLFNLDDLRATGLID